MKNIIRRHSLFLGLIILFYAVCHLALFFSVRQIDPTHIFEPDSASYDQTAKAFLHTGRFAVSLDQSDVPQIMRTPGYPFFIAVSYVLFGERYVPLILMQMLLSIGTLLITYRIAAILWNRQAAMLTAGLLAIDIPSLLHAQRVLSDTLFTFLLTLAVFAGISALHAPQPRFWRFGWHSLLLALATLVRPISYYLIFPELAFFIAIWKISFHWRWKTITAAALLTLTPWLLLIGGWQLRNYYAAGSADFSGIQAVNLLFYRGADILAQRDGISFAEAQQRLGYGRNDFIHPEMTTWSQAQRFDFAQREGVRLIRHYPFFFAKSTLKGLGKLLIIPGEKTALLYIRGDDGENASLLRDFFALPMKVYLEKWLIGRPEALTLFFLIAGELLLIYAGIIVALREIVARRAFGRIHIFLWLILLYLIVISAGPEAYARFRVPLMPLFCVYAGHGLSVIFKRNYRNGI